MQLVSVPNAGAKKKKIALEKYFFNQVYGDTQGNVEYTQAGCLQKKQ